MRVVEVNAIEGLPGLRLVWRSLLAETPDANFHQSCQWLEALMRHRFALAQLRVLIVTSGTETVGILPLIQTIRQTPLGALRVLGYPTEAWAPGMGPLGPDSTATLMTALRYLANEGTADWDVLEFRDLAAGSRTYHRTQTALEMAGLGFQEVAEPPRPFFDLPVRSSELEDWLQAKIPSLAAAAHPARADGKRWSYVRHQPRGAMHGDGDARGALFERCLEALPSRENAGPDKDFWRDIHLAASRFGAADLNLLRCGQTVAACCYNIRLNGQLVSLFQNDDSGQLGVESMASSALRLLLRDMLANSVAHGDRRWYPGSAFDTSAWQPDEMARQSLIHHRQGGAARFIHRLTRWLPLHG